MYSWKLMADTQRMSFGQLTDWVMNFLGCIKSGIIAYFNIAPRLYYTVALHCQFCTWQSTGRLGSARVTACGRCKVEVRNSCLSQSVTCF